MEEEKVELQEPVQAPAENDVNDPSKVKAALAGFILSLIGITFAFTPGSIIGCILGFIGFGQAKKADGISKKPHQVFKNIAKPVGLVAGIAGIVMTVVWAIVLISAIIAAIAAAAASGAGA